MKKLFEPDWGSLRQNPVALIRVPKTGGKSMSHLIDNNPNRYPIQVGCAHGTGIHCSYKEMSNPPENEENEEGWTKHTIVAVVRNPYSWLVSFYNHHGGGSWAGWLDEPWKYRTAGRDNPVMDFQQVIERWHRGFKPTFMQPSGFITEQLYLGNTCKADVIIRFEKLQEGWGKTLAELCECESVLNGASLPHENKGRAAGSLRNHYNEYTIGLVQERFAHELACYGYTIDGPTDDSVFIDPAKCHRTI